QQAFQTRHSGFAVSADCCPFWCRTGNEVLGFRPLRIDLSRVPGTKRNRPKNIGGRGAKEYRWQTLRTATRRATASNRPNLRLAKDGSCRSLSGRRSNRLERIQQRSSHCEV